MDNKSSISLTQRIVGAIIVLSLAIIFVPALLETDRLDPGKFDKSPIPEVPREISTIVFQLNEETGTFEGEGLTASDKLTQKVTKEIEDNAGEVDVVPSNELGNAKPEDNITNNKRTISLDDKSTNGQFSWMLQLASFKEESNAIKLRDALRQSQYVAHVDERKLSQGSLWRVRVGPVLSKKKILSLQKNIEKDFKMKGLIVRRR